MHRPISRSKVVTVLNLKGGVGKTHTVWLLAGACQERRKTILVIDADTQANLTGTLIDHRDAGPGVQALLDPAKDPDPHHLVRPTRYSHVSLIPAGPELAAFDVSDRAQWERSDLQFSFVEAMDHLRASYDYVIFDCPPRLSLVSFAALCASDFVIIPLEAADWGAQGVVQVTAAVDFVRSRYNSNLQLLGYLVSRFRRARSYQRSYLAKLREHFGHFAFDTAIPDLAGFEKSVTLRVPITLHAPASVEAGIARRLFAEVERRISRCRRRRVSRGGRNVHHARQANA